jgi:hypothetical protein
MTSRLAEIASMVAVATGAAALADAREDPHAR